MRPHSMPLLCLVALAQHTWEMTHTACFHCRVLFHCIRTPPYMIAYHSWAFGLPLLGVMNPTLAAFLYRFTGHLFNFSGGCWMCSEEVVWLCHHQRCITPTDTLAPANTEHYRSVRCSHPRGYVVEPHCSFNLPFSDDPRRRAPSCILLCGQPCPEMLFLFQQKIFAVRCFCAHILYYKVPCPSQGGSVLYIIHRYCVLLHAFLLLLRQLCDFSPLFW